jgi:hypothetical protein
MRRSRRELLAAGAAAVATGLAGCTAFGDEDTEEPTDTNPEATASDGDGTPSDSSESADTTASVNAAVAAEWNAMRARLRDALSLGLAADTGAGASVAQGTFARFEQSTGEYGAHEMLEETNETNYTEFEEALGELRTEGLQAGDIGRAREETNIASTQLAEAQQTLVGDPLLAMVTRLDATCSECQRAVRQHLVRPS